MDSIQAVLKEAGAAFEVFEHADASTPEELVRAAAIGCREARGGAETRDDVLAWRAGRRRRAARCAAPDAAATPNSPPAAQHHLQRIQTGRRSAGRPGDQEPLPAGAIGGGFVRRQHTPLGCVSAAVAASASAAAAAAHAAAGYRSRQPPPFNRQRSDACYTHANNNRTRRSGPTSSRRSPRRPATSRVSRDEVAACSRKRRRAPGGEGVQVLWNDHHALPPLFTSMPLP